MSDGKITITRWLIKSPTISEALVRSYLSEQNSHRTRYAINPRQLVNQVINQLSYHKSAMFIPYFTMVLPGEITTSDVLDGPHAVPRY